MEDSSLISVFIVALGILFLIYQIGFSGGSKAVTSRINSFNEELLLKTSVKEALEEIRSFQEALEEVRLLPEAFKKVHNEMDEFSRRIQSVRKAADLEGRLEEINEDIDDLKQAFVVIDGFVRDIPRVVVNHLVSAFHSTDTSKFSEGIEEKPQDAAKDPEVIDENPTLRLEPRPPISANDTLLSKSEWVKKYPWPRTVITLTNLLLYSPQLKKNCVLRGERQVFIKEKALLNELRSHKCNNKLFKKFQKDIKEGKYD